MRVERQRGHRRLGVLLSVLAAAGLSAGAVAVLHSRLFAARSVVIAGAVNTSRSEILDSSGLWRRAPPRRCQPGPGDPAPRPPPLGAFAAVSAHWPSTVAVAIVERVPVATTRLASGGYAVLDSTGRVLADEISRPFGLPLVVIGGPVPRPGATLGAGAGSLLPPPQSFPRRSFPV